MKIALFGASGMIGQRILQEALSRGHIVTAIVRNPSKLAIASANVEVIEGDLLQTEKVATLIAGHDAVVDATSPGTGVQETLAQAAHSLISAAKQAGVSRVLVVGGAGSLEVAPGVRLVDTPQFPDLYKPRALAQGEALKVYRTADIDWTFISPAILIQPGERTANFRTGGEQVLFDAAGQSQISCEDYAVGLLDVLEQGKAIRQRITFAY